MGKCQNNFVSSQIIAFLFNDRLTNRITDIKGFDKSNPYNLLPTDLLTD